MIKFDGFVEGIVFVMPVPDQVRDDLSGVPNILEFMDSGFRQNDTPGVNRMKSR